MPHPNIRKNIHLCILGFGIELMTEIAKYLQFNVTFKLVDDGKYGSINEHGRWNGMIKEVKKLFSTGVLALCKFH